MLYDKRWDERKQTIFSLDALIDWLRQQYAEESYCYLSNGGCLLAQYFRDCGLGDVRVGAGTFSLVSDPEVCIGYLPVFDQVAWANSGSLVQTFGEALERALAIKAAMETTHA